MRRLCNLLSFVATVIYCPQVLAQAVSRYNTFSYSVNEGLLQTTMGDMEVDKNNFWWISFPNGIQKFDGNSFSNVPVQPGLPDDKYVKLFRCKNGDLLIGHLRGISRYNTASDNFSLLYQQPATYQKPVYFIGEESGTLYCYDEAGVITAFNGVNFQVLFTFHTNLPGDFLSIDQRLLFSDNIINNKVAMRIGSTLYLLDLKEKKIIGQKRIESLLSSFLLRLKSENEVLYHDSRIRNALQSWNFGTNSNASFPIQGIDDIGSNRCVIFPWQDKMLVSFNNRLFETENTLLMLKSELVSFQNQPVAGDVSISRIREDNFGNLLLQTVNGGIRKVIRNNYPVKYFGTREPKDNNILAVLPDKMNNRIVTGGSGGLFVFDTLQRLIRHIKTVPGLSQAFYPNGIIQSGNGDYLIFSTGSNKAWRLSKDLSDIKTISIFPTPSSQTISTAYFGNPISITRDSSIFQIQHKLYRIEFSTNKIFEHKFSGAYILGGLLYNNMIISHGLDELIFLDVNTLRELKKISFKEPAGVRCFASDKNGSLYVGGNKGVFKIDTGGKILKQWNKSTGLTDECIYAIAFDNENAMWCSTNKGIFRIDKFNNLINLSKQDGLQENEFNSNVVAVAEDGEFYFGGINGVSSFYPSAISSFDEKVNVLLTGLKVNNENSNDRAIYTIEKINLSYRQNSLSFDFVAMGNYNPGQYTYQYRMDNLDKEWIQNNGLQTIRYSLSPGKYTFQLYASRQFDKDAKPLKELVIVIHQPYWRTWWFRTLLAVVFTSVLYYIINQRNRTKFLAKLQLLENERKIKAERERISKDLHDSLGAYANAVLYNTELLEKENSDEKKKELIGDLKFASKDIITSLRETVWALKKDEYSAEECLVRIRNFVQPLTRYYQHINFNIEGDVPANRVLHYTKSLNIVRIVQEAVANSIKHSDAKNIHILSKVTDENWRITIQDDGKGFNIAELKESVRGNGLNNMEQRAADAGFDFSMSSVENKGTTININL